MKRLVRNSLLTLWAATTLTFILIRQMPGDIVYQWALQLQAMQGIDFQQAEAQVKVMLNYQPGQTIWTQYFSYLLSPLAAIVTYQYLLICIAQGVEEAFDPRLAGGAR